MPSLLYTPLIGIVGSPEHCMSASEVVLPSSGYQQPRTSASQTSYSLPFLHVYNLCLLPEVSHLLNKFAHDSA